MSMMRFFFYCNCLECIGWFEENENLKNTELLIHKYGVYLGL